jgi:hypothetical protein
MPGRWNWENNGSFLFLLKKPGKNQKFCFTNHRYCIIIATEILAATAAT